MLDQKIGVFCLDVEGLARDTRKLYSYIPSTLYAPDCIFIFSVGVLVKEYSPGLLVVLVFLIGPVWWVYVFLIFLSIELLELVGAGILFVGVVFQMGDFVCWHTGPSVVFGLCIGQCRLIGRRVSKIPVVEYINR